MGWVRLTFKQKQPIHVGSYKWGVLKETDIFINGRTMWGALVNAYIIKNKSQINSDEKIKDTQRKFSKITNFFPLFKYKNSEKLLLPTYENGEFGFKVYNNKADEEELFISEDEFRLYFVGTLVHTAIEPILRKAKDEALFEVSFLLPSVKNELKEKLKEEKEFLKGELCWIGFVYLEDGSDQDNFLTEGLKIFVGADVRYGLGELELVEAKEDDKYKEKFWIKGNTQDIEVKSDKPSPYFINTSLLQNEAGAKGETFLIADFEFRQNNPRATHVAYYLGAGSKIKNNIGNNIRLCLGRLEPN